MQRKAGENPVIERNGALSGPCLAACVRLTVFSLTSSVPQPASAAAVATPRAIWSSFDAFGGAMVGLSMKREVELSDSRGR